MRASALPYAAAFERQAIPPLPQTLTAHVSDLVRVSTAAPGANAARGNSRAWWGIAAAVWHDGALGYVLIAKNTPVDLVSLSRRIARGETRVLFGSGAGAG